MSGMRLVAGSDWCVNVLGGGGASRTKQAGGPRRGRTGRPGVRGESGRTAAVQVARPGARDVQLPVHRRVTASTGIDQVDRNLGVLDPSRLPVYWRWTPTVWVPFFTSPVSSTSRTAASSCRRSTSYSRTSSRTPSASRTARHSRCCMPCGLVYPAHSAIVQQFLRGRSDSRPSTNRRARNRGSTRANRPAIRPMATSNAFRQRTGSML